MDMKPIIIALGMLVSSVAHADTVDMHIIRQLESSGHVHAHRHVGNDESWGLYQVTRILLADYNKCHHTSISINQLYNVDINTMIATWYMNRRIPQLLKHFHIADTVDNRLIAYNAGIKSARTHHLSKYAKSYLVKYHKHVNA